MKVSLPLCVCVFALCTPLAGCGDQPDRSESEPARTSGAPESTDLLPAESAADQANESAAQAECPDPCAEQNQCGQICITLKGAGSSCQLIPTVNDLSRPPRSVWFDCSQLQFGGNGYDFDRLGHITLTGDTCEALTQDGPHRVALILGCPPS